MASESQRLSHFFSGNYAAFLADAAGQPLPKSLLGAQVGALVFLGQLDEAQARFESIVASQQPSAEIEARFFLGLGAARTSDYARAAKLFAENLQWIRREPILGAQSRFFVFQGLAFYRFFQGRFAQAQRAAEKASFYAFAEEFTYGQVLALDLLGHAKIQRGSVREGLGRLREALARAEKLGNGGIVAALRISLLRYEAQFGVLGDQTLEALRSGLAEMKEQDTYSRGEIILELARQLLLRGRAEETRAILETSFDSIYRNRNRRQAATLNLRYANLLHARGEDLQALHFVRTAESNLIASVDTWLQCQMAGLKLKTARTLGDDKVFAEARSFLATQKLDHAVHRRILGREVGSEAGAMNFGEDPLGDLIEASRRKAPDAVTRIIASRCYGLLNEYLEVDRTRPTLVFDLVPGSLCLLHQGEVSFVARGLNGVLRRLAQRLSLGPATKEELVLAVWGYEYHPLRHDALVYATIAKLRTLLGRHDHWIEWGENGYRLRSGAIVRFLQPSLARETAAASSAQAEPLAEQKAVLSSPDLNYRQMQALDMLRKRRFLGVSEYAELFEVSKITASRDLGQLFKRGRVQSTGRARATRYFLNATRKHDSVVEKRGSTRVRLALTPGGEKELSL